jgi:hypothetical protein
MSLKLQVVAQPISVINQDSMISVLIFLFVVLQWNAVISHFFGKGRLTLTQKLNIASS